MFQELYATKQLCIASINNKHPTFHLDLDKVGYGGDSIQQKNQRVYQAKGEQ
jgi:hypothetical protein